MPRVKSEEKVRKEQDEILEKLQKEYGFNYGSAVAILTDLSASYLKRLNPQKFCEAYLELPEPERDDFFRKMKFSNRDFDFWKECRLRSSQLGMGSLSVLCSEQMVEIATDLKQLSEIYSNNLSQDIKGLALQKAKKVIKDQKK